MSRIFRLPGAVKRDPEVVAWMNQQPDDLAALAQQWFDVIRACGEDVLELLHDDQPTGCVGDAAFAYVDAFTAHVNVGFFNGVDLADPSGLLEGAGKHMRHVKLRPGKPVDARALTRLINTAYKDTKGRLR